MCHIFNVTLTYLTIGLDSMLQAIQLPTGIAHLNSRLADMDWNDLPHFKWLVDDLFPIKTIEFLWTIFLLWKGEKKKSFRNFKSKYEKNNGPRRWLNCNPSHCNGIKKPITFFAFIGGALTGRRDGAKGRPWGDRRPGLEVTMQFDSCV